MAQRTFSIIKPDAVRKGYTGAILAEIEKAGFKIVAIKKQSISKEQAKGFYDVHAERPFFDGLCDFMSSGPMVLMVLEKENAIADSAQADGRHQSRQRRRGNHPQEIRRLDPGERHPRIGRRRHGGIRDRLLVRRVRADLKPASLISRTGRQSSGGARPLRAIAA